MSGDEGGPAPNSEHGEKPCRGSSHYCINRCDSCDPYTASGGGTEADGDGCSQVTHEAFGACQNCDPTPAREAAMQVTDEQVEVAVRTFHGTGGPPRVAMRAALEAAIAQPPKAREALARVLNGGYEMSPYESILVDRLLDPAKRDAVLRALGLREERDASGTLHRFVTEWGPDDE